MVMLSKITQLKYLVAYVFVASILIHSCDRGPTAAFRIEPTVNPEAGDSIFFINESIDALSYEWDFGNGKFSEEVAPVIFFDEAGTYKILLNAVNGAGEDTLSQVLSINEPTIMGFRVFEPDSLTPLVDCNIWVYDNQADWYEYSEPQFIELTDMDGIAIFKNLEDIEYFITIYKETSEGLFIVEGKTNALELNANNLFAVATEFYPGEQFKSVIKSTGPGHRYFTRSLITF